MFDWNKSVNQGKIKFAHALQHIIISSHLQTHSSSMHWYKQTCTHFCEEYKLPTLSDRVQSVEGGVIKMKQIRED